MCATLLNTNTATTQELHEAVDRKLRKFGSLGAMPPETRTLVEAGLAELDRRHQMELPL